MDLRITDTLRCRQTKKTWLPNWCWCLLFVICTHNIFAKDLSFTKPERVGFNSERLARIDGMMENYINAKELVGAVTMVARRGEVVHYKNYGKLNLETGQAMPLDGIFRIYSMSKPITAVAAMMLYEQGKFQLNDPVEDYLPEFKNILVLDEERGPVTQEQPFTIKMLLTHTSGLTYGAFGDSVVDQQYRRANVLSSRNLEEMVAKLGNIPLQYQPGTRWHYSVSSDVLGRLVEVISGQPFDQFLRQHIFEPLEMDDTFFQVPTDKISRFGTNHRLDVDTQELEVSDRPDGSSPFVEGVTFFSGGGGLLSTAEDYMRFCQMLLNGGELHGKRLLGKKTVEYMTRNHLDGIFINHSGDTAVLNPGIGYGLGFGVMVDVPEAGTLSSLGEYNWGGLAGTLFWIDPEEDLAVVAMIQHSNLQIPLRNTLKSLIYSAIDE